MLTLSLGRLWTRPLVWWQFHLLSRGRDPRSNIAYLDLSHVPTGFWRLNPLSRIPNRVAQLCKHTNISWFSRVFPEKNYLLPAALPWNQKPSKLTSRPQLKAREKIYSLSWSFWAMEVFRLTSGLMSSLLQIRFQESFQQSIRRMNSAKFNSSFSWKLEFWLEYCWLPVPGRRGNFTGLLICIIFQTTVISL